MCRSMADIQSTAAEIRWGKKKDRRRRKEITGQKYNGPLLHRAAIKTDNDTSLALGILRNLVKTKANTGSGNSRPSTTLPEEWGTRQILVIQPLQQFAALSYVLTAPHYIQNKYDSDKMSTLLMHNELIASLSQAPKLILYIISTNNNKYLASNDVIKTFLQDQD